MIYFSHCFIDLKTYNLTKNLNYLNKNTRLPYAVTDLKCKTKILITVTNFDSKFCAQQLRLIRSQFCYLFMCNVEVLGEFRVSDLGVVDCWQWIDDLEQHHTDTQAYKNKPMRIQSIKESALSYPVKFTTCFDQHHSCCKARR